MSDLTAKFTALEEQLTSEHTEEQAVLDAMSARLDEFSTTLDTLLANNAVNTRMLLAAIGQNSPCMPCPTPPLVIPPTGVGVLPIDPEACQRAQAFMNFMAQAFTVLDLASSVGIGFTPSLVTDAFTQVIASLTGGDSPNVISFPEAVQLVGDLINYVVLNLLRGATLSASFTSLYDDIRDAVYFAGTPAAAQSAYAIVIAASGLDSDIKTVLTDAAYNDIFSYFFDSASDPDLTGIDGSVCSGSLGSITACTDFATTIVARGGHNYHALIIAPAYGPDSQFTALNETGWTWQVVAGDVAHQMGHYYYDTSDVEHAVASETLGDPPLAIAGPAHAVGWFSVDFAEASGPYVIRICPSV